MAKFKTANGKVKNLNIEKYRIDWDKKSLSKFQYNVKQFFRPYWEKHVVYEEVLVAGTRMHIDIYNRTLQIAVEIDGAQHDAYNPHFHNGSVSLFANQMRRDIKKEDFCENNGITMIRIKPEDMKVLSKEWLKEKWEIDL